MNAPKPKAADRVIPVEVEGGQVVAHQYGDGDRTILFLAGGPAIRSNYLQEVHSDLGKRGYKAVFLDSLGAGQSSRPDDVSLWTMDRYAREVEAVRIALGLEHMMLYGHSFGAMLALLYAVQFPAAVKSIVVAHGMADVPFHQREVDRLMAAFGPEYVRMRRIHELNGTTDSPEYAASETLMWYRHVCRMPQWPAELVAAQQDWYTQPYLTMIGPGEYRCTGSLRNWSILADLHQIKVPALVLTGEHDALTPEESQLIHEQLPNSRIHLFRNASHVPFWETPDEYHRVVEQFFSEHA